MATAEMSALERETLRRLNDDRRRLFGQADRPIAFVCECGSAGCRRTIVLTELEYDERRRRDGVLMAHELPDDDPAA